MGDNLFQKDSTETLRSSALRLLFNNISASSAELWKTNYGTTLLGSGNTVKIKSIKIACEAVDTGASQPILDIKIDGGNDVTVDPMVLSTTPDDFSTNYPLSTTESDLLWADGESLDFIFTAGSNGDGSNMMIVIELEEI